MKVQVNKLILSAVLLVIPPLFPRMSWLKIVNFLEESFVLVLYHCVCPLSSSHILTWVLLAVANTADIQGTCLFVMFPCSFLSTTLFSLLLISCLGCNVAAGRPYWLWMEPLELQGTQQLLSSQCRSCGAGSSYIWLLGLCWQPCFSRNRMMSHGYTA